MQGLIADDDPELLGWVQHATQVEQQKTSVEAEFQLYTSLGIGMNRLIGMDDKAGTGKDSSIAEVVNGRNKVLETLEQRALDVAQAQHMQKSLQHILALDFASHSVIVEVAAEQANDDSKPWWIPHSTLASSVLDSKDVCLNHFVFLVQFKQGDKVRDLAGFDSESTRPSSKALVTAPLVCESEPKIVKAHCSGARDESFYYGGGLLNLGSIKVIAPKFAGRAVISVLPREAQDQLAFHFGPHPATVENVCRLVRNFDQVQLNDFRVPIYHAVISGWSVLHVPLGWILLGIVLGGVVFGVVVLAAPGAPANYSNFRAMSIVPFVGCLEGEAVAIAQLNERVLFAMGLSEPQGGEQDSGVSSIPADDHAVHIELGMQLEAKTELADASPIAVETDGTVGDADRSVQPLVDQEGALLQDLEQAVLGKHDVGVPCAHAGGDTKQSFAPAFEPDGAASAGEASAQALVAVDSLPELDAEGHRHARLGEVWQIYSKISWEESRSFSTIVDCYVGGPRLYHVRLTNDRLMQVFWERFVFKVMPTKRQKTSDSTTGCGMRLCRCSRGLSLSPIDCSRKFWHVSSSVCFVVMLSLLHRDALHSCFESSVSDSPWIAQMNSHIQVRSDSDCIELFTRFVNSATRMCRSTCTFAHVHFACACNSMRSHTIAGTHGTREGEREWESQRARGRESERKRVGQTDGRTGGHRQAGEQAKSCHVLCLAHCHFVHVPCRCACAVLCWFHIRLCVARVRYVC